jgi:hypothetical protein
VEETPVWLQVVFGLFIFFVVLPLLVYLVILVIQTLSNLARGVVKELLVPMAVILSVVFSLYGSMVLAAWIGSYVLFKVTSVLVVSEAVVDAMYAVVASAIATAIVVGTVLATIAVKRRNKRKPEQRAQMSTPMQRSTLILVVGVMFSLFWLTFHYRSSSIFTLW